MAHLLKRNPRETCWTVLYRRKHKKGTEEDVSKKRNKRTQKFQRAVVGATLQDIMAKRNQKPEVRKAKGSKPSEPPRMLRSLANLLAPRRLPLRMLRLKRLPRSHQECEVCSPKSWRKEINL